jgi:hypothetical protein
MPIWLAKLLSPYLARLEGPLSHQEVYKLRPGDWAVGVTEPKVHSSPEALVREAMSEKPPAEALLVAAEV